MEEPISKVLCPYCGEPWSEANLKTENVDASEGCETCSYGSGATFTLEIYCHKCERMMYKKEGVEAKG